MNILRDIYNNSGNLIERRVISLAEINRDIKRELTFNEACRYDARNAAISNINFDSFIEDVRYTTETPENGINIMNYYINGTNVLKISYTRL